MHFVTLLKFRRRPTKEEVESTPKKAEAAGIKIKEAYWCLGRFDAVVIYEAPNAETAMKAFSGSLEVASSETLVAIPRAEAVKLAGY
ncbi:MAG TPA: GYD domain-containing protein [Bacteroidota bacterium]|jgi:uncharacterized protein with GYD domain|nr:GYD domain-containing protein [Bacteroidota bacterium]